MPMELTITQNNYGYYIEFNLLQSNSFDPHSLTSYDSIVFEAQRINETTISVSGTCEITDAANGECRYLIQDGDFSERSPPKYVGMITAYASGLEVSWDKVYIYVDSDLPM